MKQNNENEVNGEAIPVNGDIILSLVSNIYFESISFVHIQGWPWEQSIYSQDLLRAAQPSIPSFLNLAKHNRLISNITWRRFRSDSIPILNFFFSMKKMNYFRLCLEFGLAHLLIRTALKECLIKPTTSKW